MSDMGVRMSVVSERRSWTARASMDVKRTLTEDVRKITTAASRLKIHTKRKDKIQSEKKDKYQPQKGAFTKDVKKTSHDAELRTKTQLPSSRGLPPHIVAATRVTVERKWTLTDLLHKLGIFVQKNCTHLHTIPSASEIAMWVRCADRALQLNGWTVNSFLMESHVVFTYMLLSESFKQFPLRTLADVKELVLMCLYVSYTYNANEISYPLRPFLVKQDRVAFWDKCTTVSLGASTNMLKLNKEHTYYSETLASLKGVTLQ